MDTFEGQFKGKESVNANWLPVKVTKVPEPRPGQCVKDSSTLPDVTLNFIKTHPLMDEAVPAFYGQPILMRTSYHSSGRFTAITVDPQVHTSDGKNYDILYIGTDAGKVLKAINTKSADSYEEVEPFIIEELVVFPSTVVVSSLRIVTVQQQRKLVVVSSSSVISIALHRCGTKKITTCSECVGLQDPYCGWDKFNRKCRVNVVGKELIQSIADGVHSNCSKEKPSHSPSVGRESSKGKNNLGSPDPHHPSHDHGTMAGDDPSAPMSKSIPLQFTAETLAIAVASAAIGALILGFITGFFCGKKCNKEEDNQLYAVTDYEYYDQRQNANSRLTGELQEEVTYAEPVLVPQSLNKPVNLLLNMSPKATLKTPASSNTPAQNMPPISGSMGLGGGPPPLSFTLAMPPSSGAPQGGAPQDIPLHYTPESYSTHGTLRSSEKFGTRGRDHKRDFDHRLHDGYSTTRSVKKVYL
ncbi:UNVERIFIED_CONTAM: hypothetical protein GTU68_014014 [Idotea baltica]|nr:hypothetical protein [Idotea baltica]